MNIKKEDIQQFLGRKIRVITKLTNFNFTYVGFIETFGDDYIRFRDKYNEIKLISIEAISFIEEVTE